ncbi:MAG: YfhO family protein [Desulfatibacillaceae bacterium]
MRRVLPHAWTLAAAAVVVVTTLLCCGHLLVPGTIPYSPDSELYTRHLATAGLIRDAVKEGDATAFWREDMFFGQPLYTDPGAGAACPTRFPFYLASPERAAGPVIWLHFLVAGLGVLAAARALGLSPWGSVFAGVAAACSAKLVFSAYAGQLDVLSAAALFPWAMAAAFAAARRPGPAALFATGVFGAFLILSGQYAFVWWALFFALAWAVVCSAASVKLAEGPWWPGPACVVAGTLLAAGFSAFHWVPVAMEAGIVADLPSAQTLSSRALSWRHLLTFLRPEILGAPFSAPATYPPLWEYAAYFGLAPLVLAVLGIALGFRHAAAWFPAAAMLLCAMFTLPGPAGLLDAAFSPALPFYPGRLLYMSSIFGVLLAGVGVSRLEKVWKRQNGPAWALVVFVLAVSAFAVVEGRAFAKRYLLAVPLEEALPTPKVARYLSLDDSAFRVLTLGDLAFTPGWAQRFGLHLANGTGEYRLARSMDLLAMLQTTSRQGNEPLDPGRVMRVVKPVYLDILGVKYMLSPVRLNLSEGHFRHLSTFRDEPVFLLHAGFHNTQSSVYRNNRFSGLAHFAEYVMQAPNLEEESRAMRKKRFPEVAVVPGRGGGERQAPGDDDNAELLDFSAGSLRFDVRCESRRFLVLSEAWHPGWRARLDGEPLPLVPADVALMGAWIPPGRHHLSLHFRPPGLAPGLGVSAALFLLACAALSFRSLRRGVKTRAMS